MKELDWCEFVNKEFGDFIVFVYTRDEFDEVIGLYNSIGYRISRHLVDLDINKVYCISLKLGFYNTVYRNSYINKANFDIDRKYYNIWTIEELRRRIENLQKKYNCIRMGLL